jgi:hypothetical protein
MLLPSILFRCGAGGCVPSIAACGCGTVQKLHLLQFLYYSRISCMCTRRARALVYTQPFNCCRQPKIRVCACASVVPHTLAC